MALSFSPPSVPTIVSIFRTFDADKSDRLTAPEFLDLVRTLMGARDGREPSQKEANDTAARIAHFMTITDAHGNVVRNVTSISLSDFIAGANSGGSLARLVADAIKVVPNFAEVLRAERGVPMSPPPPAPVYGSSSGGSAMKAAAGDEDGPVSKLRRRAAAAMGELRAVEAACEALLDTTHHRNPTVRQLLAACQSTVSNFERSSNYASPEVGSTTPAHARTGIKVTGQQAFPPAPGQDGLSRTYSAVQADEARRQNPHVSAKYTQEDDYGRGQRLDGSFSPNSSNSSTAAPSTPAASSASAPAFEIGKQVCCTYRRSDGSQGMRDVKVVSFVGSGTYAVEYEIDTVATHVSSPGDAEDRGSSSSSSSSRSGAPHIYLKGSKVLYRGGSTAEVLRVGDDETRDELGRPAYVLKVTTYTDGANLSLPP